MTQQELITEPLDEPRGIVTEVHPGLPIAADLRHRMMSLPVGDQRLVLASYIESRNHFRGWLMSQLVEGVHFGIVPGCEPKSKEVNGVMHYGVWNKKKEGGKGGFDWYPASQWTPKPSLYAAGADFICDLMGVRDEYDSDPVAWQQMGSKSGTAVQKCRLFSRATGELIGEAIGAYSHQYDPNNAVKMASKCAKVGAVINAYGLRDLFTQDEPRGNPNENPEAAAVPFEQPRAKREKPQTEVSEQQLGHVTAEWKSRNPDPDGNLMRQRSAFTAWVLETCRRDFKPVKLAEWRHGDYLKCCGALGIPTLEELKEMP